ncbi:hypothetical protein [Clavibacter sp.]|uniref:hypothetical protein n=1 Tax=Clavibacter sp. TaxID=1871044 RepID=UPI0019967583|nr:hypothetical protein [Clavibacter sp.]MBD5382008.1 hypothetical protein [Clavibacter sp.]
MKKIHPKLQAAIDNMSDEQIAKILNTKYTAADIAKQQKALEQLKEQLCNPKQVTIEGWVARDEDGFINLYNEKPIRDYADRSDVTYGFWDDADGHHLELPTTSFPSVTWNTEPKKVRITITPIE